MSFQAYLDAVKAKTGADGTARTLDNLGRYLG
jgi:hypothetical protein